MRYITLIKNKMYQRPRLGCVCAGSAMCLLPKVFTPRSHARRRKSRGLCRCNLPVYRGGGKRSVAADEFYKPAAL
jgi:hypothetical protein